MVFGMSSSLISNAAGSLLAGYAFGYIITNQTYIPDPESPVSGIAVFAVLSASMTAGAIVCGILCDRFRNGLGGRERFVSAAGLWLAAAALLFCGRESPAMLILSAVAGGLGTGVFFTSGICESVTSTEGCTRAGIFIAPGAAGFLLGRLLAGSKLIHKNYIVILLIVASISIMYFCTRQRGACCLEPADNTKEPFFRKLLSPGPVLSVPVLPAALLLAAVIFCLTVISASMSVLPEPEGKLKAILPAAALFCGLFAGGILSDCIGARYVSAAALILAVPLSFAGCGKLIFTALLLFLAGIALPVFLCELARRFSPGEALSSALFAVAAFIGASIGRLLSGCDIVKLPPAEEIAQSGAESAEEIAGEIAGEIAEEVASEAPVIPAVLKLLPFLCLAAAVIALLTAGSRRIKASKDV